MRGVCHQHHFPAVARPFRVLWAPWAPAVFFFFMAFLLSILFTILFGTSVGSIFLPIGVVGGHVAAIVLGGKVQYLATIVTGFENRRTGSTNLTAEDRGSYDFSNI